MLHGAANSRRPAPVERGDGSYHPEATPSFGAPPSPPSLWSPTASHFDGVEEEGEEDGAGGVVAGEGSGLRGQAEDGGGERS